MPGQLELKSAFKSDKSRGRGRTLGIKKPKYVYKKMVWLEPFFEPSGLKEPHRHTFARLHHGRHHSLV